MLQAYYNPKWSGRFLSMFLVSLIPFFWFNGTLTGMFTANPVVNYDSNEIINLRLFTIPIEDVVYNLLMLLVVTAVFEKINSKDRNSELA
jgi:lycopene cyclase domain-containing protein